MPKLFISFKFLFYVLQDGLVKLLFFSISFGIAKGGQGVINLVGNIFVFGFITSKLLAIVHEKCVGCQTKVIIVLDELPYVVLYDVMSGGCFNPFNEVVRANYGKYTFL